MRGLGLTRTRESSPIGAAGRLCHHDPTSPRTLRSSLTARPLERATLEREAGCVGIRASGG